MYSRWPVVRELVCRNAVQIVAFDRKRQTDSQLGGSGVMFVAKSPDGGLVEDQRHEEAPARLGEAGMRGLLLPRGLGTARQLLASLGEADRSQATRGP